MAVSPGDVATQRAGVGLPKLVFKDYEGLERGPFAAWGRLDRRTFLSATAVFATAPLANVRAAAQSRSPTKASSQLDKIAKVAANSCRALNFDGRRFSGPAYEWLRERGVASKAFLVGEEHGIAENAKLAAALFTDLAPSGYRHLAVETSPPMASVLTRAVAEGGIAGVKRLVTAPESRVAFFGLREEGELHRPRDGAGGGAALSPQPPRSDVNAAPDFTLVHKVIDAASEAIIAELGERGRHARTAIGCATLPNGNAVTLEALVMVQ